jgi:hypothetical protein
MTTVREILTKFGFRIEHEKLSRMESQLEAIKHRIEFLAAAQIVHKLFELAETFAHMGEELRIAAEATGETVEGIQELGFAAKQSGVSTEELVRSMTLLSQHLYQARMGSVEAMKAFTEAGFQPEQVQGFKNAREALSALSEKLRAIDDPIKRAALGKELLGRNSQRLAGFLAKGSAAIREEGEEARRLGIILSGAQVASLEKLEHALNKLWAVMKAFTATIAAKVAPVFEYLIKDVLEFFAANKSLIDLNIENWWLKFVYALGFVYGVVKGLTIQFLDLAKSMGFEGDILKIVLGFASLISGLALLGPAIAVVSSIFSSFALVLSATPMALILGGIALVLHDLWASFKGKPTWIEAFEKWLGVLEPIQKLTDYLADKFVAIGETVAGIASTVSSLFGGDSGATKLAGFGLGGGGQSLGGGPATTNVGGQSIEINAPMNFTVPAGTNPQDVGAQVGAAIAEHFDRKLRETRRSLAPTVAR